MALRRCRPSVAGWLFISSLLAGCRLADAVDPRFPEGGSSSDSVMRVRSVRAERMEIIDAVTGAVRVSVGETDTDSGSGGNGITMWDSEGRRRVTFAVGTNGTAGMTVHRPGSADIPFQLFVSDGGLTHIDLRGVDGRPRILIRVSEKHVEWEVIDSKGRTVHEAFID